MGLFKTHIEFWSDNFPQTSEEQKEWDGQIWGYTLAKYLAEELPKHGVNVLDISHEDWGYLIPLADEKFKDIWIGCNHYQEYENGFLVFINPSKPIIKKGFLRKLVYQNNSHSSLIFWMKYLRLILLFMLNIGGMKKIWN